MNTHHLANAYPMMPDDQYKGLKADIETNGLQEPIVLLDGLILDGRNRYKACIELRLLSRKFL